MIWALLLTPAIAGLIAFVLRPNGPRRALLLAAAATHVGLVAACWIWNARARVLQLDGARRRGLLFLSITSILFLAVAVYAVGYLAGESRPGKHADDEEELPFVNFPEAVFAGCLLLFSGDHDAGGRQPPLGPDVGRRRSHDLGQRPADLFPSPSSFARSHLEIPADLFGGHRLGTVGQFLRRRRRAIRRRAHDPSDHRRSGGPRRSA